MACLRNRIRKQKKSLLFPRIEKTTGTRKPFRIYSSNPAVGTDLVLEAALGTLFLLVLCPKTLEIRAFLASNPNKMELFPLDHEFFHLNNFVWVFYHTVFWLPLLSIEYRLSDFLLPWCCHSKKADQKYTCVQFISLKWYYTISFELSRVSFVHELFRRRFNLQSIEF